MPQIDCYHDTPDRLRTALRIVRKAVDQGCRVVLNVPDAGIAGQIDRLLWTEPPTGFLPHCRADSPLAAETPVLLATRPDQTDADDVLINLGRDVPPGFERFRRLIEIVGQDDPDKGPARERIRAYRAGGHEVRMHSLAAKS